MSDQFDTITRSQTFDIVPPAPTQNVVGCKWVFKANAFLQGKLTKKIYMSQPPGFIDQDRPDYVCILKKAIYGLKKAPKAWYLEIKNYILNSSFTNYLADASLFIYNHNYCLIYVLIYVGDILVNENQHTLVTEFVSTLADCISIMDHGDLHYFLGIETTRTNDGLHLMKHKYILDLLTKTNMTGAKPVTTPLPASFNLTFNSGTLLDSASEYRMAVGSL